MISYDNFIIVENEKITNVIIPDAADNIFYKAATTECMSDCTGDTVLMIVYNSYQYRYKGWEPGLVYTFYCEATGDSQVITLDPDRWDH